MSDHGIPADRFENTATSTEGPSVLQSVFNLMQVPAKLTEHELRSKQEEDYAAFLCRVQPYLETPKLAADQLSELLIALRLAGLNEQKLCQCLGQLYDLVTIADALKIRFQHLPVDVIRLRNLYETIVEFTQSDLSDYAKGDPQWEEGITECVIALQRDMPGIRLWVEATVSEVNPWSRPLQKADWKELHDDFKDRLWRKVTNMNGDGVEGGENGRGPWRLRKSVCETFGFRFPAPG